MRVKRTAGLRRSPEEQRVWRRERGRRTRKNGSEWNFFLLKTKGDFFLLSKS